MKKDAFSAAVQALASGTGATAKKPRAKKPAEKADPVAAQQAVADALANAALTKAAKTSKKGVSLVPTRKPKAAATQTEALNNAVGLSIAAFAHKDPAVQEAAKKTLKDAGAAITPAESTPVATDLSTLQEAVAKAQAKVAAANAELKAAKEALKAAGGTVSTRPSNAQLLKVADPAAPRKGVTALYVAKAVELGTFTRDALHAAMVRDGYEPKAARIKIADCVYFGVFVDVDAVVANKTVEAF